MLTAVISAFMYLRIVVAMWMADVDDDAVPTRASLPVPAGVGIALALCLLVTIGVGVWPDVLTGPAADATAVLVQFPTPG